MFDVSDCGMTRAFFIFALTSLLACSSFAVTPEVETFDGTTFPDDLDLSDWTLYSGSTAMSLTGTGALQIVLDATVDQGILHRPPMGTGDFVLELRIFPGGEPIAPAENDPSFDYYLRVDGTSTNRFLVQFSVNAAGDGLDLECKHIPGWSTLGAVDIGYPNEVQIRMEYVESTNAYSIWYGLDGAPPTIGFVTDEVHDAAATADRDLWFRFFNMNVTGSETYTTLFEHYSLGADLAVDAWKRY